jgi:hypothetical protein
VFPVRYEHHLNFMEKKRSCRAERGSHEGKKDKEIKGEGTYN